MIVADNTMLIPAFIVHERADVVRKLRSIDSDWLVPAIWRFEFSNVLVTQLRHGRINAEQAEAAIRAADLTLTPGEHGIDQLSVVKVALQFSISGYDAQYIAIAMARGTLYVTDDRRLAQKAAPHATRLETFLSTHNDS